MTFAALQPRVPVPAFPRVAWCLWLVDEQHIQLLCLKAAQETPTGSPAPHPTSSRAAKYGAATQRSR